MAGEATEDKLAEQVKLLLNDGRLDAFAEAALSRAESAIVRRLYPMSPEASWEDVPDAHKQAAVDIAVYLVSKQGAEGETAHDENGTGRTYAEAFIPESYFKGMVPFVGVPR